MDSEDLSFGFFLLLVLGTLCLSYYAGKFFEDRRWKALIPSQMDMLCRECAGLNGEKH